MAGRRHAWTGPLRLQLGYSVLRQKSAPLRENEEVEEEKEGDDVAALGEDLDHCGGP